MTMQNRNFDVNLQRTVIRGTGTFDVRVLKFWCTGLKLLGVFSRKCQLLGTL